MKHPSCLVDETSSSEEDQSKDDHVDLDAYMSTDMLKKLRQQNVVPSTSRGRPLKMPKRSNYEIADFETSKEEQCGEMEDVFILDDEIGALGSLPSREEEKPWSQKRQRDEDDETRQMLQSCLQDEDYIEDDVGGLSDEGDELDVFRLTQKVPLTQEPIMDKAEANNDEQDDMIELRFVDQNRHEFSTQAFSDSTFKYPCAKFVEHAKAEGWISQGEQNIAKYVFDGDIVDIDKQTPSEFGMEDGDTVDVYYK